MGQTVEQDYGLQDEVKGRYLTFWIDKQLFAVSIADVVQIVGMQDITQLPDYPHYVKGVIDLRGQIIPLVDVRLRFGKAEIPYSDRTCIIIISVKENHFGLIVDEVDEGTDIPSEKIASPPKVNTDQTNSYLTGIAQLESTAEKNRIALLLDTLKIISETELLVKAEAKQK